MDQILLAQKLSQVLPLDGRLAVLDVTPWYEGDNTFYISRIFVPDKHRNMCVGFRMMENLIREAIEAGVTLVVHPTNNYGADVERLRTFFSRFGFEMHPTMEGAMIWRSDRESV